MFTIRLSIYRRVLLHPAFGPFCLHFSFTSSITPCAPNNPKSFSSNTFIFFSLVPIYFLHLFVFWYLSFVCLLVPVFHLAMWLLCLKPLWSKFTQRIFSITFGLPWLLWWFLMYITQPFLTHENTSPLLSPIITEALSSSKSSQVGIITNHWISAPLSVFTLHYLLGTDSSPRPI